MFSITYRFDDSEVTLSAGTVEDILALDNAYRAEDDDGWIEWDGGDCPVDRDTMVEYRLRCGEGYTREARILTWTHANCSADIIAYKVVKNA